MAKKGTGVIALRILSEDDARQIKEQATLVLRSLRRRAYCECARPLRDGRDCIKCGRGFRDELIGPRLALTIREMDRMLHPPCSCPACGDVMTLVEGSPPFHWCEVCQRARQVA